jgi:CHASE2 domain-containing sensor protein
MLREQSFFLKTQSLARTVVLSLGHGDLLNGFNCVTAQLWEYNNPQPMKFTGSLPASPEIAELYRHWRLLYSALYQCLDWHPRIEIEAADVTNVSAVEFSEICREMSTCINIWLNSPGFRNIDQQLRTQLNYSQEIRFIIETNDNLLQRIPWHLWKFFTDYPNAELALSGLEYQKPKQRNPKKTSDKVKILAIFGNSQGIDIQQDKILLEQLSEQAVTEFLVEPSLEKLNDKLWQDWDILFFAGHSSSKEKGVLQINQTDSLSLDQLKFALNKAIERGLKLAIFNSCDGLGLAQSLASLQIPQVIVMREPVANRVAQEFLRHFLKEFYSGASLHISVRSARERLQGLEKEFPCATWLPVICQNPAVEPTNWQDWFNAKQNKFETQTKNRLSSILILSLAITFGIMGVRRLGIFQGWELKVYDQLMRLRPNEKQDQRLLIVKITEEDFQLPIQQQRKGSLSDLALAQLLEKLSQYQPRAIGLDIYRDYPVDAKQRDLDKRMRTQKNFFAICKVRDSQSNHPGISPPDGVPIERQGFSDVVKDSDGVVRRHLLAMKPNPASPCTTPYALSAALAFHYLQEEGISAAYNKQGNLQLGNIVFPRLQPNTGGYQATDTWGYQILLNYRSYHSPLEIVPTVTLSEVLKGKIKAKDIKNRIVLIGVTAQSTHDQIPTPYSISQGFYEEMPGVILQAQMVSQILSAVKDERPIIRTWGIWGEVFWVWCWASVSGVLVWRCKKLPYLLFKGASVLGILYISCFGLLIQGIWIPFVPSVLAILITGSINRTAKKPRAPREEKSLF